MHTDITSIKNNCIKLKVEVGMAVLKSMQTKVVGIRYMLHPYIFQSNGISMKGCNMYLIPTIPLSAYTPIATVAANKSLRSVNVLRM